jgi:DNA-binding GntR family transcriptional regulator
MSEETLAMDRALAMLEQAISLGGVERAEAFEQFHDALAAALDTEPGD